MSSSSPQYSQIVCGGTFDLLHKGHKSFLKQILEKTDNLILGLTSDEFASKKEGEHESFNLRKKNLEEFLSEFNKKIEIVLIDDMFGPLLSKDVNPDVIALTNETIKSLSLINGKRNELGLSSLKSIIVPLQKAEDGGVISSTRIRKGEINRNGRLYLNPKWKGKILHLPDELRYELQKPFGHVLDSLPQDFDPLKAIVVGDITTKLFNEKKVKQKLSIVDFKVHREKKFDRLEELNFAPDIKTIEVENEASTVSPELIGSIINAIKSEKESVIIVNGEEDLAVIPCLLVAPLGFLVFYGQPEQGLVRVLVSEQNKDKGYDLASKFASS